MSIVSLIIRRYQLVLDCDYQVLLCKDRHVWEILYLKIIIDLVIMSTDDVLENSESSDQRFHDVHVCRARSLWIMGCHPLYVF